MQFSCNRSGTTSRPANRFTREAWGISISRRTMAAVTAFTLYPATCGTPATAISRLDVPDLMSPASAAA